MSSFVFAWGAGWRGVRDECCQVKMGMAGCKAGRGVNDKHLPKSAGNEKALSSFLCLLSQSQESEHAVSPHILSCF